MFRSALVLSLIWSCHGQYQDLRADMTFDADNDRYDVGNIMEEQKQHLSDIPSPMETEWRRNYRPLQEVLKQDRRRHQRKNTRRQMDDFAYHDQMLDENYDTRGQYENNLQNFKSKPKPARRNVAHFIYNKFKNHMARPNPVTVVTEKPSVLRELQNVVMTYLHGGTATRQSRRRPNSNPENEILLHYAVPLNMKVKGFLQVPKDNLI